jgi:hypothetical protein
MALGTSSLGWRAVPAHSAASLLAQGGRHVLPFYRTARTVWRDRPQAVAEYGQSADIGKRKHPKASSGVCDILFDAMPVLLDGVYPYENVSRRLAAIGSEAAGQEAGCAWQNAPGRETGGALLWMHQASRAALL